MQQAVPLARRFVILVPILLLGTLLDRWSKIAAQTNLRGQASKIYWNDFFRLEYAENEGAFLSMGDSLSPTLRFWLLGVLPAIVMVGLLLYVLISKEMQNGWLVACFSLILAGGVNNLYDRFAYGKVVDFMNMGIGNLRTGIFNFADVYIMIGIFVLFFLSFTMNKKEKVATTEESLDPEG